MDNLPCFSPDNTRCQLAGFEFNEGFDCKVCLKTGYIKIIRTLVTRGHAGKLTAAAIMDKISGNNQSGTNDISSLPCKYRGKLLQRGSCRCRSGNIWECRHPDMLQEDGSYGRQIGRCCGKEKCKGYVQS